MKLRTQSKNTTSTLTEKQDLHQIQKKSVLILQITGLVVTVVLLLNIGILFFTMGQLKTHNNTKLQISTTRHSTQELQNVVDFLTVEQEKINVINDVLPSEKEIIDFIQTVEALANTHSQSSALEFSGKFTSSPTTDAYIPFTLKLETDWVNLQELLTKLEKLPYLVEVTQIEANSRDNEGSQIWSTTIQARVYVQDPFKD